MTYTHKLTARQVSCLIFLSGFLLGVPTLGKAQGPMTVSPHGGTEETVIADACPTFSWSDHAAATAFRIEIYERRSETLSPRDEMALLTTPVLTQTIAAPAFAWTPPLSACLTPGGRYLWYVQAQDADGQGPWSTPTPFTVHAGLSLMMQQAVDEAVERALSKPRSTGFSPSFAASLAVDSGTPTSSTSAPVPMAALEGASNTFYGYHAGANTAGDNDAATFIGANAGAANTTGSSNTFVGRSAGRVNTTGSTNTFVGAEAGYSNTTGTANTFVGQWAGRSNTTGSTNTFVGTEAGRSNTTATGNTFVGELAGRVNTTGSTNTFVGYSAGIANTTGVTNTFVGAEAGYSNTIGYANTFMGHRAGRAATTGSGNTFFGTEAGRYNTTGTANTFVGYAAGWSTTGSSNTFMGHRTGVSTTTGSSNTFMGNQAGVATTTGSSNTFVGTEAGRTNTTGTGNVFIGNSAGFYETGSNRLYIDNSNISTPLIYGEFDTNKVKINGYLGIGTNPTHLIHLSGGAYSDGSSWINASSRTLKEEITLLSLHEALQTVRELAPVTFRYRGVPAQRHAGFIAEDVPVLVATPERKGLSALEIVAVLTRVVQEQQRLIDDLSERLGALEQAVPHDVTLAETR